MTKVLINCYLLFSLIQLSVLAYADYRTGYFFPDLGVDLCFIVYSVIVFLLFYNKSSRAWKHLLYFLFFSCVIQFIYLPFFFNTSHFTGMLLRSLGSFFAFIFGFMVERRQRGNTL
jgi:hypothetical protein